MKQALTGAIFGVIFFFVGRMKEVDPTPLTDGYSLGVLAGMTVGGAALYLLISRFWSKKSA